ncbi:hypothetical protein AB1Y20_006852 [Prymnesium parvum]|uniref:ShKT domain-containing protein n=1 Tax=Prymnesium parvum TaxID=97485 RepID=A0AB34IZK2_PRYPA
MLSSRRARAPRGALPRLGAIAAALWLVLTLLSLRALHADPPAPPAACADLSPACAALEPKCAAAPTAALLQLACPRTCRACDAPTRRAAGFRCADARPECEEIARSGRCDARPLAFWRDCPRACGVCGGGGGGGAGCADARADCAARAARGECRAAASRAAMARECAKACGSCQRRQPAAAAPPRGMRGVAAAAGGGGCRDTRRACAAWRREGECERSRELMGKLCARSCGECVPTPEEELPPEPRRAACSAEEADVHEDCADWAAAGECEHSPRAMAAACGCGRCGGSGAARRAEALEAAAAAEEEEEKAGEKAAGGGVPPQLHLRLAEWCTARRSLPAHPVARGVELRQVRLTPGSEFYAAQQLNTAYLLDLSVPRLLWSFYATAGLPADGEPYGGWEEAEKGGWPDPRTPTRTLRGHFVGHYLSALALAYSSGGDVRLAARAALVVRELERCQQAAGTGFISAWPEEVFDTLEAGNFADVWAPWYTVHKILAGLLDAHAHLHGDGAAVALRVARKYVAYLARRVRRLIAAQGDEWWQATLEVEFGGIAEAAYRLHALSPNETAADALHLARAFTKRDFIGPLSNGEDALAGRHANTHLPLLVSASRAADVEGDDEMLTAPMHAYCLLQLGYAYAGSAGSSVNEHWPPRGASTGRATRTLFTLDDREDLADDCEAMADDGECERAAPYMEAHCAASCAARRLKEGAQVVPPGGGVTVVPADSDALHTQESCTQYNALKLNAELFSRQPHAALADAFERKLINGVMGIQHPQHPGEMIYMMPLGAGVSKERSNMAGFGAPDGAFWCCYGTGIESFAKLGDNAYFETPAGIDAPLADAEVGSHSAPPTLWVSQFIPSSVRWRGGGVLLHLTRDLAVGACDALLVAFTLAELHEAERPPSCFSARGCTILLRVPSWADPAATALTVNGAPLDERGGEAGASVVRVGEFVRLHRRWSDGDRVAARFGLYVYVEPLNDWRPQFRDTYALLYGPYMLVGLVARDEMALAATVDTVRSSTHVSECKPARPDDASASWANLRLETRAADGKTSVLMALSAAVEQQYTAYFRLASTKVPGSH